MSYSFKRLWKLLIDKDMKKKDLAKKCGISNSTLTRMKKNENVSVDVLDKICKELNCDFKDIMEHQNE